MMQHSVANYVNINDYDYDKQIKQKNKDIAAIQAQINALSGIGGDSVKARREKLQAELQEKQEDLEDTRFDHLIDIQQQGFDKLSKDMQDALDNAVDLINGNQKVLQEVADSMLQQLVTNGVNEGDVLNQIKESSGTAINNSTQQIIDALSGPNGIKNLVSNVATEMSVAISKAIPAAQIAAITAHLPVEDANMKNIENAIRQKAAEDKAKQQAEANLKAATDVIKLIEQIGTVKYGDSASQTRLNNAQNAFNKLTDAQKALVSNKGVLENAQSTWTSQKKKAEDAAAAEKKKKEDLKAKITGQEEKVKSLEQKMKEAYDQAYAAAQKQHAYQADLKNIQAQIEKTKDKKAKKHLQTQQKEIENQILKYRKQYTTYRDQYNAYKKQIDLVEKVELQKLQTQLKSLATGTKRFGKNGLAWTNENLKNGSELIIRPSDGAILTPLKANDAVIPANLANNLFKWGAINPDSFAVNPFMGKWGESIGGKNNSDILSNNTTNQSIDMHFDSLITVQGNVDADVVSRLEDLSKNLTSNKDFQKNVIKFVTKDFVKESRKLGLR